jgi:hypothetical protein
MADQLPKSALEASARKLGLWRENTIVLSDQGEMYILLDFALHSYREQGLIMPERHLADQASNLTPEEKLFLEASIRSRFRVMIVENVVTNLGINVRDLLTKESMFLVDQAFSHRSPVGSGLAGRIVELPDFALTTGVAVPLPEALLPILVYKAQTFFHNKPLNQLSGEDNVKLQLIVLQLCLAATSSQKAYA